MAVKRKLELDADDNSHAVTKQLKLVPFPNMSIDTDVAMYEAEPTYPDVHHSRLPSNASSISTQSSYSPGSGSPYPSFDLYPSPFFDNNGGVNTDSHNYSAMSGPIPAVGLMQPTSGFVHHGTNCTQIPKLRVACASGLNGQRTMWSHCEQCGAIAMVDSD